MPASLASKRVVEIVNLRKVFNAKPDNKVAVDDISLDMYEDMIFSFLGHNGAGKSTTMAMLTGMMPATSGACYVYGRNVELDTSVVHTMTGYCPQHDVLFDELSVYEHLELFCALKNIPKSAMPAEINERLAQVGLLDRAQARVGELSGGMKRKLSVAIAFTGGSKLVVRAALSICWVHWYLNGLGADRC